MDAAAGDAGDAGDVSVSRGNFAVRAEHLGKLTATHARAYASARDALRRCIESGGDPKRITLRRPVYDTLREAECIEREALRMGPMPTDHVVVRGMTDVRFYPK